MKFDRDAYAPVLILAGSAAISSTVYLYSGTAAFLVLGTLLLAGAAFSMYFFRDPERRAPDDPDIAVSAADGVIVDVSRVDAEGFDAPVLRIAVFMNVFNVHVNRSPVPGVITGIIHRDGKKLSAFNKRAAYENEHGDIDIASGWGLVRIRQIAGLVARRVVIRVTEGMTLERGAKIGIIRFGSRVDVFLPDGFKSTVAIGHRVRAGETIIARYTSEAQSPVER